MDALVLVDERFDVSSGHQLALSHLKQTNPADGIAYVARSHRNNGITAWIEEISGLDPAPAGRITVALRSRNHALASFVQPRQFYTSYHVAILSPRRPMTLAEKLWYCECIEVNRFKFNFGRQANRTLSTLPIPASVPAWVEDVMYERGRRGATRERAALALDTRRWEEYLLSDLFELHAGRFSRGSDLPHGSTPFVTASDTDNGITKWVALEPDWPGGQITVPNNGSIGAAFYQGWPFTASRDVTVLDPKFPMTPAARVRAPPTS